MTTFYLQHKKNKNIIPIGEASFNKFYPDHGWDVINAYINENDSAFLSLFDVRRDDDKKETSIEDFLIYLNDNDYKVIY